jgi:hypothetical protein
MLRMQERVFPGLKFEKFSADYAPNRWPSAIGIPL